MLGVRRSVLYHRCVLSAVRIPPPCSVRPVQTTSHHGDDKKQSNIWNYGRGLGLTVALASLIGLSHANSRRKAEHSTWYGRLFSLPTVVALQPDSTTNRRQEFNFIADAVELSAPAVVYIEIRDLHHVDFFTQEPMIVSNGSGFIIDPNGLILTNAHVIFRKPHMLVTVKLQDGRTFTGRIEHVDPTSDLATVRIQCENLPSLKLGNSSVLRPGEWVVALGSPLALSNTVTVGVVSTTHRASQEIGLRGKKTDYIQTDAAITFGNSGGPLVNLNGEAIGINSLKVAAGISFAIPSDHAKEFLCKIGKENLCRNTSDESPKCRRYVGITMLSITREILQEMKQGCFGFPSNVRGGVLVWKVIEGSPAHRGGLHPGDIITSICGTEINSSSDMYEILNGSIQTLAIVVYRGEQSITVLVEPEDASE